MKFRVYMRCVTWSRDSHGLFDYESRYIQKKNIKTYTGGKIVRLNNDVEFISKLSSAEKEFGNAAKPLIIISERNGKYTHKIVEFSFSGGMVVLIFYKLGKFYVENDTLVPILKEDAGKVVDEDVNNKMFIVVRNLKTTPNKIVRNNDYQ